MKKDTKCKCGFSGDGSIKSFTMRPLTKEESNNAKWEKVNVKPVKTTFKFWVPLTETNND